MVKKFDGTPEDMWRIANDLAGFFRERDIRNAPDQINIFALLIEHYATTFPDDRVRIAEYMMKVANKIMTDGKEAN